MWSTIGSRRKWIGCNIIISQVFPHAQPGHSWMNGWWIGQPWLTAVSAMNGVQKDDEIIPSTHMFFVYFFIKKKREIICFVSSPRPYPSYYPSSWGFGAQWCEGRYRWTPQWQVETGDGPISRFTISPRREDNPFLCAWGCCLGCLGL